MCERQWCTSYVLPLVVLCFAQELQKAACVCPSPYYPPTHTACAEPSSDSVDPRGVTLADQKLIVDEHNKYRAAVEAADMLKMYWDDELAFVAQRLAEECQFGHDTERGILCKYSAGQNLALGYNDWADAIKGWYDETEQFEYGISGGSGTGHYTQIMWNSTQKVGCGFSHCTNLNSGLYVCNYAPAGNLRSRILYPYTEGERCSACPNHCNDGLCDCGGLVCKNKGVLDLRSCTCLCSSPYQGSDDCNLDCSHATDDSSCDDPDGYSPSDCSYSNVPPLCPIMCDVCPGNMCMALQSYNIADSLGSSELTTPNEQNSITEQTSLPTSTTSAAPTADRRTSPTTATTIATARTTPRTTSRKPTTRAAKTTRKQRTTRPASRRPATKTTKRPPTLTTRRNLITKPRQ